MQLRSSIAIKVYSECNWNFSTYQEQDVFNNKVDYESRLYRLQAL